MRDELKWSKISEYKYPAVRKILEAFFRTWCTFSCVILRKEELDFEKYFGNDFFEAYCSYMIVLLKNGIADGEIATILADDYFSPKESNIEGLIRNKINDHFKRLVIGGCCQINSRSSDILQVTDLLLGAILYDLKIQEKAVDVSLNVKTKILGHIHNQLGVSNSFFLDAGGKPQRNFSSSKIDVMIFDPAKSKRTLPV